MDSETYLKDHGLDKEFVKKNFGWKFDKDKITIPYIENGKHLFNRYRHLEGDSKFTADKGSHPRLYCPTKIKNEQRLVYCEGEPDMVKLWQEGIPAITAGGVTSISKVDISSLADKEMYLCLDSDLAGQKAIKDTVDVLETVAMSVKIMSIPKQYKDVSEYFVSGKTKENFEDLMIEAKELNPIEVVSVEQFKQIEFPKAKWLIKNLVRADGLNLVVGQSGVGKSLLCLSIIKAVASGENWMCEEFNTQKKRVLIIDKENSDTDLQNNLKDMEINGDVFIVRSAELFNFVDDKLVATPQANKIKKYVEANDIDVILLDSMIDFYVGSEDSSTDFNFNFQVWREIFGNRCILTIHHENKQPVKGKRNAKDRSRGSTNIVAQANSIISISNEESSPEIITIEHTKVRGAKKHTPFQIEMKSKNEYITNRSMVTGFSWRGNIEIKKLAEDRASDAILNMLAIAPEKYFKASEILSIICDESLGDDAISERTAGTSLAKMRSKGQLDYKGEGGPRDPYVYKYPTSLLEKLSLN